MTQEFRFLLFNALDDSVEIESVETHDENNAWEQLDEASHIYDQPVLLTPKREENLRKLLESESAARVRFSSPDKPCELCGKERASEPIYEADTEKEVWVCWKCDAKVFSSSTTERRYESHG